MLTPSHTTAIGRHEEALLGHLNLSLKCKAVSQPHDKTTGSLGGTSLHGLLQSLINPEKMASVLVTPNDGQIANLGNVFRDITIRDDAQVQLGDHHVHYYGMPRNKLSCPRIRSYRHWHFIGDKRKALFDELSTLSYKETLQSIQEQRMPESGQWLLKSHQYQQWRDSTEEDYPEIRHHSLWCHGPGQTCQLVTKEYVR